MMLAVLPLLALPVLAIVVAVAWFAYKWLKTDPHRDMVILMGPKSQGKSELKSALMKQGFKEMRPGTGVAVLKSKYTVDEDDVGCKKIVTFDSGGEGSNIRDYVNKVVDYIDEKRPEYLLVVLVIQRLYLQKDIIDVSDLLGEYLDYIVKGFDQSTCENVKKRYRDGFWAYAIATTHCDKLTCDESQNLSQIEARVEKRYSGRLRRMDGKKKEGVFELSKTQSRNRAISWVVGILKDMHEE